jgi:hypothetical protein
VSISEPAIYRACRLFLISLCILFSLFISKRAYAFDWDYSSFKYELTQAAVTGERKDFLSWSIQPKKSIQTAAFRAVKGSSVTLVKTLERKSNTEIKTEMTFKFHGVADSDADLFYTVMLVIPLKKNGSTFPVVAFDGHGDCGGECSGNAPERMFRPQGFANRLVEMGYSVVGFPTAMHKPFISKSKKIDFPVIWASLAWEVLKYHKIWPQSEQRYIAIGNAIGGLTALALSVIDQNSVATIVNGSFFPLELTRREYRIKNHPFCHDFREFNTYTTIYALIVPRPLMIQVGAKDGLWLGNGAVPPSDWFSGIKRGATVDETLGASFVLERIWRKFNAPYELVVHGGGHEDFEPNLINKFILKFVNP